MKQAAALCAVWIGLTAVGANAQCTPMTNAEVLAGLRTSLNCSAAAPTTCTCISNGATKYNCPAPSVTAWNSTGQQCVKANSDKNAAWDRHANGWDYPAAFGASCKVHPEPGSYACTKVKAAGWTAAAPTFKPHAFQMGHAGYNSAMDSEGWCTSSWCFVDPCTCNATDFAKSSWFAPRALYYSYQNCGGVNTFSAAVCSAGTSESTCTAISNCKWTGTTTVAAVSASGAVPQRVAAPLATLLVLGAFLCFH